MLLCRKRGNFSNNKPAAYGRFYSRDDNQNINSRTKSFFDVGSYNITDEDKRKWREFYKKLGEEEEKKIKAGKKVKRRVMRDLDLEKEYEKKPWQINRDQEREKAARRQEKLQRLQEKKKQEEERESPIFATASSYADEEEYLREKVYLKEGEDVDDGDGGEEHVVDPALEAEFFSSLDLGPDEKDLTEPDEENLDEKTLEILMDPSLLLDDEFVERHTNKNRGQEEEGEGQEGEEGKENDEAWMETNEDIDDMEEDEFFDADKEEEQDEIPDKFKYVRDSKKNQRPYGWEENESEKVGDEHDQGDEEERKRQMSPAEKREKGKDMLGDRSMTNLFLRPSQNLIAKTRKHKILSNLVTIDLIEMITHSRRKRDQKLRRKVSVLRKYKAKKWKKYGAQIKASWARKEERRKINREIRLNDPNWFYYKEINFWIHKKNLLNPHIRRAIPVLLKNPSFTNKDKKKALDYMVTTVEEAENKPKEWYDKRAAHYKGVYKERNQTTPDRTRDPDFQFPETYEELIAKAEESMLPADKANKYSPSPFKPREKTMQNY